MPFRINAKNIFLTYSQSKLDAQQIIHYVTKIPGICQWIVARERHQDGNTHFHCLYQYTKKVNITNERHFDLYGEHPRIESVRDLKATISYCKKEGDYYMDQGIDTSSDRLDCNAFSSEEDWLIYCIANKIPFGYAQRLWCLHNLQRPNIITDEDIDSLSGKIGIELSFHKPGGKESTTVLIGPTGIGKTSWAIKWSEKPSILISHIDDLKQTDLRKLKSIIFDDMTFTHWPRTSQIHLVDQHFDRSINARYSNITIPKNTQKIFTSNEEPLLLSDQAIKRRVHIINLNK